MIGVRANPLPRGICKFQGTHEYRMSHDGASRTVKAETGEGPGYGLCGRRLAPTPNSLEISSGSLSRVSLGTTPISSANEIQFSSLSTLQLLPGSMQMSSAYTGWTSHSEERFGLPLPPEQGRWLPSKNNCPVNRYRCAFFWFKLVGSQTSGRKCGLISAVTLLHSSTSLELSASTMWMSLLSLSGCLQLTLSPLPTLE